MFQDWWGLEMRNPLVFLWQAPEVSISPSAQSCIKIKFSVGFYLFIYLLPLGSLDGGGLDIFMSAKNYLSSSKNNNIPIRINQFPVME